jgi:DNA-binding transcriptional regulator YbjK
MYSTVVEERRVTVATSRRERLADAAIDTLAREGLRGLTHRAVDRSAGVPEGSCSYYFRTRRALLTAAADRLADADAADLSAPRAPRNLTEAADAAAGIVEHWTTTGRVRMLARYELALESTRRPELRTALVRAGTRARTHAERLLAAAGVPDAAHRAPYLAAYLDGLIFDHLAGAGALAPDPDELRAALLGLLRAFTKPTPAEKPAS